MLLIMPIYSSFYAFFNTRPLVTMYKYRPSLLILIKPEALPFARVRVLVSLLIELL